MITTIGHARYRAYAMLLHKNDETVMWIGTTIQDSPLEAAKNQINIQRKYKYNNFLTDAYRAAGCSSFNELVYEQGYYVNANESFF